MIIYPRGSLARLVFLMAIPICASAWLGLAATAEDWPMYRHDAARSGLSGDTLSFPLALQWAFIPPDPPDPAWPEPMKEIARTRFDEVWQLAVAGDALCFGSSADGKVYCLDAATGALRWTFRTGGPIRVAPTLASGSVYAGSDDGFAYCLNLADGSLVWKVRAAYRDDLLLGNGRMISRWPVRTGVLVDNGVACFGAGVFPHESLFLVAVDAATGAPVWRNDTCGEVGYQQDYGGMTMEGPLLASEKFIFAPSGRAMPAVFNRADGTFHAWLSPGGKFGGTWAVLTDDLLVAGVDTKRVYQPDKSPRTQDAPYAWFPGLQLVVAPETAYLVTHSDVAALDRSAFAEATRRRGEILKELDDLQKRMQMYKKRPADPDPAREQTLKQEQVDAASRIDVLSVEQRTVEASICRWRKMSNLRDALVLADKRLVLGGENAVAALDTETGEEVWRAPLGGRAGDLAVAGGRLYVSTTDGRISCFATGEAKNAEITVPAPSDPWAGAATAQRAAETVVKAQALGAGDRGYALVLGVDDGALVAALARTGKQRVIAIEPDTAKAEAVRAALDSAGLYGNASLVIDTSLDRLPLSNLFADVVVSEAALSGALPPFNPEEIRRMIKPCGGALLLPDSPEARALRDALAQGGEFTARDGEPTWVAAVRGPLPGAGAWTHQYADAGNTACSDDTRVRGPLGVLWFGNPGPAQMVERHARAAAPLAQDGRMFVQGENVVMAYDAYNGAQLWERQIPGAVRVRVDSDMSNFALGENALYVAADTDCFRLDPATGETVRTFTLPEHGDTPARWGYLACVENAVIGTVSAPLENRYSNLWDVMLGEDGGWRSLEEIAVELDLDPPEIESMRQIQASFPKPNVEAYQRAQQNGFMWHHMSPWPAWGSIESPMGAVTQNIMAGNTLFALDADSGALRWRYDGGPVAHPAIAAGDGPAGTCLFLADCGVTDPEREAALRERDARMAKGLWEPDTESMNPKAVDVRRVVALDVKTGAKIWERVLDLTGCGGDRLGLAYQNGTLCFFGCFSNHDRTLFKDGKLAWRRVTAVNAADGADLWSKPLNYLRRPVIVGDELLIEPRACDLRTGAIRERLHPMTGDASTWEYVRPGHCCSATSACPNMFFLRGFFLWYFDLEQDLGMLPFGGIRPGCWINTIPANGLVLFPEASAGCTCSYPVRTTVVLEPRETQRNWALFVQNGPMTPVKHLAINLGAPGDRRAQDGTLWLAYPHPPNTSWYEYGLPFKLQESIAEGVGGFYRESEQARTATGSEIPWVFASGCRGLTQCAVPLLDAGQGPGRYTVRLYFIEPDGAVPGRRVFDVRLQGQTVLDDFDIAREAGAVDTAVMREFTGIAVDDSLRLELVPSATDPSKDTVPVLNAIEILREDIAVTRAAEPARTEG